MRSLAVSVGLTALILAITIFSIKPLSDALVPYSNNGVIGGISNSRGGKTVYWHASFTVVVTPEGVKAPPLVVECPARMDRGEVPAVILYKTEPGPLSPGSLGEYNFTLKLVNLPNESELCLIDPTYALHKILDNGGDPLFLIVGPLGNVTYVFSISTQHGYASGSAGSQGGSQTTTSIAAPKGTGGNSRASSTTFTTLLTYVNTALIAAVLGLLLYQHVKSRGESQATVEVLEY